MLVLRTKIHVVIGKDTLSSSVTRFGHSVIRPLQEIWYYNIILYDNFLLLVVGIIVGTANADCDAGNTVDWDPIPDDEFNR